jgi:adenosine deaminase
MFDTKTLRSAPKVLLHDHLDGGLRPATVIDIARQTGYRKLPTYVEGELASWMVATARRGNLELYLEAFAHTVSVMQTRESLFRVAAECAEDLASDGIIYAEIRFAPELHLRDGLTTDMVIDSVLAGFAAGSEGTGIRVQLLVCAIRSHARSKEMVELALRFRNKGVVGFDIAGSELGHPPIGHQEAFNLAMDNDFPITIHAGEVGGSKYIEQAIMKCGATRIGHGLGLRDDIFKNPDGEHQMGSLASLILEKKISLEMCPTSNVHIGTVRSIGEHPIDTFLRLGFCTTINTDNRLMSQTNLSKEMEICSLAFGWHWDQFHTLMENAANSSFLPSDEKLEIVSILSQWASNQTVNGEN